MSTDYYLKPEYIPRGEACRGGSECGNRISSANFLTVFHNCLCVTVLCRPTIIMVHKDTSSSYRSVDCIGL